MPSLDSRLTLLAAFTPKHLVFTLKLILETGETFKQNHRMIRVWEAVVELDDKTEPDLLEQEAIDRAGQLVGYFDAFDPTGRCFRCPEDIKDNRYLAEHKLINLGVLRDQMQELKDILERWIYEAASYRDWQLEQRADYGAE